MSEHLAIDASVPPESAELTAPPPPKVRRWPWRALLALVAGAGAAFAFPPFGFLPGLLGYPLLLLLMDGSRGRWQAFRLGCLAGFAYFFVGCWWVAEAFLVDPAQAWMAPFAAALLPAGIGLFWGAACAAYRWLAPRGPLRVLVFAALFMLFEWLRGHVLSGFPWNPAGAVWPAGSAPSQAAAVLGIYGLGLVTVAAACAFAPLATTGPRKGRIGMAALGALAVVALFVSGAVRLAGASVDRTGPVIRIVQADVGQQSKWSPEAFRGIVQRYVNLTERPGGETPAIVVWPEGALPASTNDLFADGAWPGQAIAASLQPGQTLLMGGYRGEPPARAGEPARFYNSLFALHDEGGPGLRVAAIYDKHRLVPFGEYLPLGDLMGRLGVRSLVHMAEDFSPGPAPRPITLPGGALVQPLICYESLYPGFSHAGPLALLPGRAPPRPAWIANVSNDAWFGRGSGPRQHLNLAAYRAIEEGLPMVRATPTGVSAFIDPYGRVLDDLRLDLGESGVIDGRLPAALPPTPYAVVGDGPFWLLLLLGLTPAWRRRHAMGKTIDASAP